MATKSGIVEFEGNLREFERKLSRERRITDAENAVKFVQASFEAHQLSTWERTEDPNENVSYSWPSAQPKNECVAIRFQRPFAMAQVEFNLHDRQYDGVCNPPSVSIRADREDDSGRDLCALLQQVIATSGPRKVVPIIPEIRIPLADEEKRTTEQELRRQLDALRAELADMRQAMKPSRKKASNE